MKVYFDESGNTGCIIPNKNGAIYNDKQRFFVLAGVICSNDNEKNELEKRYLNFKRKYHIEGEIKGSDMMKRENNTILVDFIDNLVDDSHFYVCCYDKIFYLATIINSFFYPRKLMNENPVFYFTQASALTQEDISLFIKYCECNALGTEEAALDFCKYITEFDFQKIDKELNGYYEMAKLAIENGEAFDFTLPPGSYYNDKFTHIINMTALGETLLMLKGGNHLEIKDICVIHDRICEFEKEYQSFQDKQIDIQFKDSKDEVLLQYADNIASIFRKCITETVNLFRNNKQWDIKNRWYPELFAKLLRKVSVTNVKWDVAISDRVLSLCVAKMFFNDYPIETRNDYHFYKLFFKYKEIVMENVASLNYNVDL